MSASFERAFALYQENNYKDAFFVLNESLPENPDADELSLLALCEARLKNFPAAIAHAEAAIEKTPADAHAHCVLGQIRFWANNAVSAVFSFNEAIRLNPGEADYYFLLSDARAAQESWNYSLTAAQSGLAIDPTHAGCIRNLITAFRNLNRLDEARDALAKALAKEPTNADYRTELETVEMAIAARDAAPDEESAGKEVLKVAGGAVWPVLKVLPEIFFGVLLGRVPLSKFTHALADGFATFDEAVSGALNEENPNAAKNRRNIFSACACVFGLIAFSIGYSAGGFVGALFWLAGATGVAGGIYWFFKKRRE